MTYAVQPLFLLFIWFGRIGEIDTFSDYKKSLSLKRESVIPKVFNLTGNPRLLDDRILVISRLCHKITKKLTFF